MGEQKSDGCLPEGWRVEVRVRKNGKKDKCYFPPSGGCKFYSKVEVSRYLNNGRHESEDEEKSVDQQSSRNVVVEKAIPDGLPPGWTKEVRVTKKGGRIRRDPFYIAPLSGYVFRSMKDALRYLETGESGSQAFKRKDRGNGDMELEDDKTCSSAFAKKTSSLITSDHSPKLSGHLEEKEMRNSSSIRECILLSDQTSGGSGTASSSSEFPMGRGHVEAEPLSDCARSIEGVAPAVRGPQKHSLESGITKNETKKPKMSRSKKKKDFDLPRRTSKRLAGIPLDPMPELESSNRAHQAADKQPNHAVVGIDAVASTSEGSSDTHNASDKPKSEAALPDSNKGNHPIMNVVNPGEQALKREINNEGYKKLETANISPLMNLVTETANNSDQKLGLPLDLPLEELWQDPCIAFAIKTLTGMSFDNNSDSMKAAKGSNNNEFGALGTSEGHAQIEDAGKGSEQNQGCGVVLPLGNITIPDSARVVETTGKCDKQPDVPFHFPSMDAWADPCIEFAIKTLTGAIPLDYNMIFQDHQQAISSQSQERSGLSLPNVDGHR